MSKAPGNTSTVVAVQGGGGGAIILIASALMAIESGHGRIGHEFA